jgi:hypothetical protein
MGFLPRAGIENYLKKITDPDEREAREEGKWRHLSGLVYKELDRAVHLYQDFDIPADWMRIEAIDPHDSKPTRWLFGAVSPEEILINGETANRIYWYTYLLATGSIADIVHSVKVRRAEFNYKDAAMVIIDVKYGAAHKPVNGVYYPSWEEELDKAGIKNVILSNSCSGDVALGHKRVKEYLQPQYSTVKDKSFPGMMFAEIGCKGPRGPIQDMFNYQWDQKNPGKPEEQYKDFCDDVRYAALEQPVYQRPMSEKELEFARLSQERDNTSNENLLYSGLRIRS